MNSRATCLMIEPAKFRHRATIRSYTKDSALVASDTLSNTFQIWYSFLSSSGLLMGQDSEMNLAGDWLQLLETDKVVFRFLKSLQDDFYSKKRLKFSTMGSEFSVTKLSDVNGEGIYSIAELERVQ